MRVGIRVGNQVFRHRAVRVRVRCWVSVRRTYLSALHEAVLLEVATVIELLVVVTDTT